MQKNKTGGWKALTELFESSIRQPKERKIGIEVERIGMWPDGSTLTYRRTDKRPGMEDLFAQLSKTYSWKPKRNLQGDILEFSAPNGILSLEPGSQLELSMFPAPDLYTLIRQTEELESQIDTFTLPWELAWIGLGVNPVAPVDKIPIIPYPRYEIMTKYLSKIGSLATSMMRLTTSVQVNLDYTSEKEAVEMLRVALAVAPYSYGLFANSPIKEKKNSGFLSYRSHIWQNMDPARSGLMPEAFHPEFNFDAYAQYLWKLPLMFVQQEGTFREGNGITLAELKNPDEANTRSSIQQLFTEARLKLGYLEVRSVDGLNKADRYAAAAFWTGLLYQEAARREALEVLGKITPEARQEMLTSIGKKGLDSASTEIALRLVETARQSLKDRNLNEEKLLLPIYQNLEEGLCPAQRVLKVWESSDISKVMTYSRLSSLEPRTPSKDRGASCSC